MRVCGGNGENIYCFFRFFPIYFIKSKMLFESYKSLNCQKRDSAKLKLLLYGGKSEKLIFFPTFLQTRKIENVVLPDVASYKIYNCTELQSDKLLDMVASVICFHLYSVSFIKQKILFQQMFARNLNLLYCYRTSASP